MAYKTEKKDLELMSYKAEILKAIAHPVRLCILRGLAREGFSNVGNMQTCLDVPQATVSQHLAKTKAVGIIKGKRKGTQVVYSLTKSSNIEELIKYFLP
ncbi:MAG: metalloregulator ArsR/SmtB family transcription factor [Candidatus Neomarinimicrobiota bacterium]|jgi:ArsR family transcriptional regulator|nr:metalloregulator ArsR/SmtB family transcription factor [Candidatus Neomarinimicrobiota bacterium]MDD3966738.1 metalloregulator ArsR/SmtB family transcription factor [Candidatus Neomarinimicrobiota bacterium]MDX9779604.1 metalloregulator ArsR/SmtB family transcription factor [bacterium]